MKTIALAIASLWAVALPTVAAESFSDRARVVSVQPVTENIPVSREQCWNDRVRTYEERRVTRSDTGASIGPGTVLGAVIGGVVGHQFGNSSGGRDRGTAAGAVVGGLIGNQVDRDQGRSGSGERVTEIDRVPVDRNVERCRVVEEVREARVGYDVRYAYGGREFQTRLDRDPGRFLRVNVNIEAAEGEEIAPLPPPERPASPTYR